jgi:predicted Zn-dependent protease
MSLFIETQLDLTGQVLEQVRKQAGDDAEAEVVVDRAEQGLTRFANSFIHQNVADAVTTVRLRLHLDGRTATGTGTLIDADGLAALVERTIAASRLLPADPGWPGLAPPQATTGSGNVDEATIGATPDDRAAQVRSFVDAAGGLSTAGYCRTTYVSTAFANSAGQAVAGAWTAAGFDGIARTGSSDGVARLASVRLADLDGGVLGARAAAKARAGVDPVELPPGHYEVVLEPCAVFDVLVNLAVFGFNGKAFAERRTFVELGAAQFDQAVTLLDDPSSAAAIGLPFDVEGTPRRRLDLVSGGVTRAVTHDRRTAAQLGTESTGHAIPGGAVWGPVPFNVSLEAPGGDTATVSEVDGPAADSSVTELLANVERGLLVSDLWYTRVLDPRTVDVTGLTRNGVWLIENGEVRQAVRDLRFTQSYPGALAPGAVRGVGSVATALPDSWEALAFRAPALHLASWNFTGGASG